MSQNPTPIERIVMRHEDSIDKLKDRNNELDKKIVEIGSDVKSVLEKLDAVIDNNKILEDRLKAIEEDDTLEKRVGILEDIQNKREWLTNKIIIILKYLMRLWWFWLLIIICFFAFDLKIEVQNPHLVDLVSNLIKNKF